MKLSLLSLAILLGNTGCYSIYHEMDIDAKYSSEEMVIIRESLNDWAAATGSQSALIYTRDNQVIGDGVFTLADFDDDLGIATMQKVSKSDPGYPDMVAELGEKPAGVAREGQLVLTVTETFYKNSKGFQDPSGTFDETYFHMVLLHELGHFFGLMHGDGSLMVPGPDANGNVPPDCIDQMSVENFCNIHGDCITPHATCPDEEG
jgi:hypothetical protein